jgi:hypothetical protein
MPITYRTSGPWGPGKGGNLTPGEVDTNFYDLVQQLEDLELGPTPAEIDNIVVVGNQMTIILDDARQFGPFTLPTASFRWRGNFVASTAYAVNDLVTVPGLGVYLVLNAHTSGSTFNPDLLVGGLSAYQLVLQEVRYAFDYRGDWAASTAYLENDVISVAAAGVYLVLIDHTSGSSFEPSLSIGGNPVYQLLYAEPRSEVLAVTGATFSPIVIWGYHRCTNTAGCAVTLLAEATQPFPIGTEFHFRQSAAGPVSVEGAFGVTINVPAGANPETASLGAVLTVKKVASDEWDIFGLLAEATA